MEHLNTYLFSGMIAIVLLLIIIGTFWAPKDSLFAKWFGVNFKRMHCPNCNHQLPIIRKPTNSKEALFGGWTCNHCGTQMDKFGNQLK